MTPTPSIALIGKAGVGKTTIATALQNAGYNQHSWAGPVRLLASWAYGQVNKSRLYEISDHGVPRVVTGRVLLQTMATESIRAHVDEDFWVRVGTRRLDANGAEGPWVNDDTRFQNEVEALARRGWVIVRVTCPEEMRIQRLVGRDGAHDPATDEHTSETLLDNEPAHLLLHNTGTPAQVAETLLQTIARAVEQGGTFTNTKEH